MNYFAEEKYEQYKTEPTFKALVDKSEYRKLMMMYGHDCLLLLLSEFEKDENYRECSKIKMVIEGHNEYVGDILPTR